MRTTRTQSVGEEIANSITHGLGFLLSIVAVPVLVIAAIASRDIWRIVAGSIYATTLVLLYAASTLYHALPGARVKAVFQRLDHAAIYLLIAGTYTPFTLISLRGVWGWSLFGIVWGLAAVGVALKGTFGARLPALSTGIYLAMGWLVLLAAQPLSQHVAPAGVRWLIAGGVLYTAGIAFFIWERLRYSHAVWHLFVLGGSVAHFCAVFWYALPATRV